MKKVLLVLAVFIFLGMTLPKNVTPISKTDCNEIIFVMEEEGYIDDIPFDTSKVIDNLKEEKAFKMEEEGYIDDIPFDTRKVVDELI